MLSINPNVIKPTPRTQQGGGKRTLRRGMNGLDVARCQNLLNSWMVHPDKVLWVDGMFGPKTDKGVRKFQQRVRIKVDGVVGPQTWAMLEA